MYDFDELFSGLHRLGIHESRHAMRAILYRLGDPSTLAFDETIADRALARLTDAQREALTGYCQGFLPPPTRHDHEERAEPTAWADGQEHQEAAHALAGS